MLTYALSALTLGLIRVPKSEQGPPAGARPVPFRAAMGEGLTFVRKQVILRRLLLCTSVCNFFVTAASSIAVTFLLRDLHASATTVGLVFTLGSVGGLVTGAFARRISARIGSARVIWVSMLLPGPLYFLMPLSQPGWGSSCTRSGWPRCPPTAPCSTPRPCPTASWSARAGCSAG